MLEEIQRLKDVVAAGLVPRLSALQGLLQGSVRLRMCFHLYLMKFVEVNGGVAEVIKSFPPMSDYGYGAHIPKLCSVLQEFLKACRASLDIDKEYIKSDQSQFHQELENGFQEMEKLVVGYINQAVAARTTVSNSSTSSTPRPDDSPTTRKRASSFAATKPEGTLASSRPAVTFALL